MVTRLVLAALALSLATPAVAQSHTVEVPYGDLDLTKDTGRDALDRRLSRAAQRVCGTRPARSISMIKGHWDCLAEVRAAYQPQVELALDSANARRVAVLADKLVLLASF
jgi:UrcA family protein